MGNNYNLISFKLSINVYNKLADNLLSGFREAISNEITFNENVQSLEKFYGIKLDVAEFNKLFNEEKPELVEAQKDIGKSGTNFDSRTATAFRKTLIVMRICCLVIYG